jgi:hypothetical protein
MPISISTLTAVLELSSMAALGKIYHWTRLFRREYFRALRTLISSKVSSQLSLEESSDFSLPVFDSLKVWFSNNLFPFASTLFNSTISECVYSLNSSIDVS